MNGPVSHLNVRYPTDWELHHYQHLHLAYSELPWDPAVFDEMEVNSIKIPPDPIISAMMYKNIFHAWSVDYSVASVRRLSSEGTITPEYLSNLWSISLEQASNTLKCTNYDLVRLLEGFISRRVKTKPHQRMYNQLHGYLGRFASDTIKANVTSLRGNKYLRLFSNRGNYIEVYPNGNVYDFIFELLPHEEECIDVTYDTDGVVIRPDIDNLVHKELTS